MTPEKRRKRFVRAARTLDSEQIRRWICDQQGNPCLYLLRSCGYEVLHGWTPMGQVFERTIEDDFEAIVISEHLKSLGLVFDSDEDAIAYARQKGWLSTGAPVATDSAGGQSPPS